MCTLKQSNSLCFGSVSDNDGTSQYGIPLDDSEMVSDSSNFAQLLKLASGSVFARDMKEVGVSRKESGKVWWQ